MINYKSRADYVDPDVYVDAETGDVWDVNAELAKHDPSTIPSFIQVVESKHKKYTVPKSIKDLNACYLSVRAVGGFAGDEDTDDEEDDLPEMGSGNYKVHPISQERQRERILGGVRDRKESEKARRAKDRLTEKVSECVRKIERKEIRGR